MCFVTKMFILLYLILFTGRMQNAASDTSSNFSLYVTPDNSNYTEVGEGFNPEVGYLSRNDGFIKFGSLIWKQWRPKNTGKLLEVRPHIAHRSFWNFDRE